MSKKITLFFTILALAMFSSLCQAFVKVPGTAVIMKVVAASDNISATSEKEGGSVVYQLGMLKPYFVMAEEGQTNNLLHNHAQVMLEVLQLL